MVAGSAKGGSSGWADYLDSTEILVEGDSSWTTVGAVKPGVRRGPSIITLNNKVFMFGKFCKNSTKQVSFILLRWQWKSSSKHT